jgi:hypothetical protein
MYLVAVAIVSGPGVGLSLSGQFRIRRNSDYKVYGRVEPFIDTLMKERA